MNGYTDGIEVSDVTRFESQLLNTIRKDGSKILTAIREEKALSDQTETELKAFLDEFTKSFS